MKISVTQYAKVLYEVTNGKPKEEISNVVAGFVKILERDNKLKLKEEIIQKFTEIHNKENGILEAEVSSREKLGDEMVQKIKNYISRRYEAKEVIIENIIDEKMQGGIIIRIGNEIMDASVARQLEELGKKLAN